jgi:NADPH2:quinone reductase
MKSTKRLATANQLVTITEASDPLPQPHEALIAVKAFSVNRGEMALLKVRADGWQPGQDFAGIVLKQAADGSGPAAGTRVAGLAEGRAWSEQVAVKSDWICEIPEDINFETAAALPMTGLTALRTLNLCEGLPGQKILITAGAGGVGQLQTQLAALAGAEVTAIIRNEAVRKNLQNMLPELLFVASLTEAGQGFNIVLDSVGGEFLAGAIRAVQPGAIIVLFGNTAGEPTSVSLFDFMPGHENTRLITYFSYHKPVAPKNELGKLLSLVSRQKLLVPSVSVSPWLNLADQLEVFNTKSTGAKFVFTM